MGLFNELVNGIGIECVDVGLAVEPFGGWIGLNVHEPGVWPWRLIFFQYVERFDFTALALLEVISSCQ
jgi:hypothetical protein